MRMKRSTVLIPRLAPSCASSSDQTMVSSPERESSVPRRLQLPRGCRPVVDIQKERLLDGVLVRAGFD